MKKNTLITFAGCALALVMNANAASIAATNIVDLSGNDVLIVGLSGSNLASGIASTGYFTISDASVATLSSTYSAAPGSVGGIQAKTDLIAAFVGLSNDNFIAGGAASGWLGPVPGLYSSTAELGAIGLASPELNKLLYTFYGSGADLTASTGIGLALHTGLIITRDDNVATPDANDAGLANPFQGLIRGAVVTTTFDPSNIFQTPSEPVGAAAFQLVGAAPIPEPSAALLGALGALGLLRRRRN